MRASLARTALAVAFLISTLTGVGADDRSEAADPSVWQRIAQWRTERIAVTDTWLLSAAGVGYAAIQDTRMTPLVYRAAGFAGLAQSRTYRPNERVFATAFFHVAAPNVPEPSGGEIRYLNPRGTVEVTYLRPLASLPLSAGGGLSLTGNLRQLDTLGNSALNYDISVSINPELVWEQTFALLDLPARWHLRVTTPLVSWLRRSPDFNLSRGDAASYLTSPWRFYRFRVGVGVSRLLPHSDENRLRLDYRYDFYGTRDEAIGDSLTLGTHTLTLGTETKAR